MPFPAERVPTGRWARRTRTATPGNRTGRALLRPASRRGGRALVAVVAVLALGATAACDTADAANQPDPPKKGGTLNLVFASRVEHLDPQRIAVAIETNVSRLITRTLTTFKAEPGAAASEIVGDLATDTGRPSDGNRVWEFTLKRDVRWQDGTPIGCPDLKYGVERNFSSLFTTGLQYPRQLLLDNTPPYQGPFTGDNNNGKGLESVQCVDEKTVRFQLKQPVGDFGYAVAMTVFAPVPRGKDEDKAAYDRQPFSSGPYKIAESTGERIVFDRNPHWAAGTDQVRKAYPDRILLKVSENVPATSHEIIQDQGEARNTVQMDADIASNFVQQVINDPELSNRLIQGSYSGVRFLAINTRLVRDVRCRQALAFAANKRKFRSALGGAVFGELARSAIAPGLRSHKEFDLYNTVGKPEGDRDRARQLLAEAGSACPKKIVLAFPEPRRRLMASIAESFQLAGIETELRGVDPTQTNYFADAIGRPNNQYHVMWAGWIADWSNGSAVIPPLFSGKNIPAGANANGNQNFSLLNDPQINQMIDEAMAESDLERQYAMWGNIDQKILEQAAIIPLIYMTSLRLAGSNVRGGFIHPATGAPDLTVMGLANP